MTRKEATTVTEVVWARSCSGWNMSLLAQLFGSGPKMQVVCGRCGSGFAQRIAMVDYPIVLCPCGTPNRLNLMVS